MSIERLSGMLEEAWRSGKGASFDAARTRALVSVCEAAFKGFDAKNVRPAYGGGMLGDWKMSFSEIRIRADIGSSSELTADLCMGLASMLRETIGLPPLISAPMVEDDPEKEDEPEDCEAGMAGPE